MELSDLQHRDIFTYPKNTRQGLDKFGVITYNFLYKLKSEEKVYGCFFSYYFNPPSLDPHIKIAVRYSDVKQLMKVSTRLDKICDENKNIIENSGIFKSTEGSYRGLPDEIVVDYIGCYSFKWILNNKSDLIKPNFNPNTLADYFFKNKTQIDNILIKGDIYRNSKIIEIKEVELEIIRGRFVHYICNIIRFPYNLEPILVQILSQYGWKINIFNR